MYTVLLCLLISDLLRDCIAVIYSLKAFWEVCLLNTETSAEEILRVRPWLKEPPRLNFRWKSAPKLARCGSGVRAFLGKQVPGGQSLTRVERREHFPRNNIKYRRRPAGR